MNKKELIKLVDKLNLPKDEYCILSSGSLLMYGLRDIANDLDLHVTISAFNILKSNYKLKNNDLEGKYNNPFYKIVGQNIEFFVMEKEDMKYSYVDGYPVQDLNEILKYKLKRNALKDQNDIEKIKVFLSLSKNNNI